VSMLGFACGPLIGFGLGLLFTLNKIKKGASGTVPQSLPKEGGIHE
jgi:hypothetical protein